MGVTKPERRERITKLIAELENCNNREEIEKLGEIEHEWLVRNYEINSAAKYISSEYVAAINKAFPPSAGEDLQEFECWQKVNGEQVKRHLVVKSLKLTEAELKDRNSKARIASALRINAKIPLYPEPLISEAIAMLDSKSWATLTASLILLTGRRPTEMAWSGDFSLRGEYSLMFAGQLKKKGNIEADRYEIPTLIAAERVLNSFERLRALQKSKTKILEIATAAEADRKTNNQINKAIRQYFGRLLKSPSDRRGKTNQLSASNLRAAYGKIAAHYYCPPSFEPIIFVAKILGHQTNNYELESLGTTISYYTYRIVNSQGEDVATTGIHTDRFSNQETGETEFVTEAEPVTEVVTVTEEITEAEPVKEVESVTKVEAVAVREAVKEVEPEPVKEVEAVAVREPVKEVESVKEVEPEPVTEFVTEAVEAIAEFVEAEAVKETEIVKEVEAVTVTEFVTEFVTEVESVKEVEAEPVTAKSIAQMYSSATDVETVAEFVEVEATTEVEGNSVNSSVSVTVSETITKTEGVTEVTEELSNQARGGVKHGKKLADRLGVTRTTIGRSRDRGEEYFRQWSSKNDPQGVGWKYLGKGKVEGIKREVDIYVPLGEITEMNDRIAEDSKNSNRADGSNEENQIVISGEQLKKFNAIANILNLKGNGAEQLDSLLEWVEGQQNRERVVHSQSSRSKDNKNEQLITDAIVTIAKFSENLNNTLVPLTEQLERVVNRLEKKSN